MKAELLNKSRRYPCSLSVDKSFGLFQCNLQHQQHLTCHCIFLMNILGRYISSAISTLIPCFSFLKDDAGVDSNFHYIFRILLYFCQSLFLRLGSSVFGFKCLGKLGTTKSWTGNNKNSTNHQNNNCIEIQLLSTISGVIYTSQRG